MKLPARGRALRVIPSLSSRQWRELDPVVRLGAWALLAVPPLRRTPRIA